MLVWFRLELQVAFKSAFLQVKLNSLLLGNCNIRKPEVVFQCFLSKQGTNFSQKDDTFINPYLLYFASFVYFYWTIVLRNKYQAFFLCSKTRQRFSPVIRPSGESFSFTPFHSRILLRNHGQNQRHSTSIKPENLKKYQDSYHCGRWLHHHNSRGFHVRFYSVKQSLTPTTYFFMF